MLAPFLDQGFLLYQGEAEEFARLPGNVIGRKDMAVTMLGNLDYPLAGCFRKVGRSFPVECESTRGSLVERHYGESGAKPSLLQFRDHLPFYVVVAGQGWIIETKTDSDHDVSRLDAQPTSWPRK